MSEDEREESEAAEERRSQDTDEPEGVAERPEIPEADAIEQSQPLVASPDREPRIDPETPEADALDQSRTVADAEDDERR